MFPQAMPYPARFVSAAAVALMLAAGLTACSDAELEVADVKVGTPAGSSDEDAGAAADTASPSATPSMSVAADDPDLEAAPATVGAIQLRLPTGWSVMDGMDAAASGASGAVTYSELPAAGKDQMAWLADLVAGETEIVVAGEGVTQQSAVALADGTEVFHVVQNYSDNRAHIFGTVKDDTLHLLRFGLDGTPETAAVAAKAVSTAVVVSPAAAPTPSVTPSATSTVPAPA